MTAEITTGRKKQGRARGYIQNYKPQKKTLELLKSVDAVLKEYEEHWPLTCRQVYYRLIGTHGYEKTKEFYWTLCHHMANARRGGMIPFDAIRDDGVTTVNLGHFADIEHFRKHLRRIGENYRRDKLARQKIHIEVWCEAAGMIYQLADVAEPYSVKVYSCSGFDSLTAKKDLAERICEIGKPAVILHLGDYDPSGESIFESAAADVAAFVEADKPWNTVNVRFVRVALTADQVRDWKLPTAPLETKDTKSLKWSGETCQLETLPPDRIATLLRNAILMQLVPGQLDNDRQEERRERQQITRLLAAPLGRGAQP